MEYPNGISKGREMCVYIYILCVYIHMMTEKQNHEWKRLKGSRGHNFLILVLQINPMNNGDMLSSIVWICIYIYYNIDIVYIHIYNNIYIYQLRLRIV